jgi:hypothetical protein
LISNGVIDDIVLQKKLVEAMDAKLLGTVFNNIDMPLEEKVKGELIPIMERYEIKFYGYVPEKAMLNAPSAKEYYQALGGQVLVGNEHLERLILSYHIGAMRTESAMKILKRFRDYALITGGDRSDLISRALENTDIGLLILTGNLYPEVRLLVKAEEKEVPVLLVPHETSVSYNICQNVRAGIAPEQDQKIQLVKESIKNHIKWKEIYDDA